MSKNTRNRILLTAVAALLLVTLTIGGTIAWLTAETSTITNTFTPSTLDVTLTETWNTDADGNGINDSWTAQMIPGATIVKDPKVSYTTNVDAWLFVKVTESDNFDDFMTYAIDSNWTPVDATNYPGVYYRAVTAGEGTYSVIQDANGTANQVTVNSSVTKELMDALTADTYPTLSFQAYIIQKEGFDTAEDAWEELLNPTVFE